MDELAEAVAQVDVRAHRLLAPNIEVEEEELLSEAIDEEIHRLHYKLDHTRRLLEGSESGSKQTPFGFDKALLVERVAEIRQCVVHLQEHFGAAIFDHPTVLEVHGHMDELEGLLTHFHTEVQTGVTYWRHRGAKHTLHTSSGLPLSLVAAVMIDSFIDGFLIGISCAFKPHAGLVLAAANGAHASACVFSFQPSDCCSTCLPFSQCWRWASWAPPSPTPSPAARA